MKRTGNRRQARMCLLTFLTSLFLLLSGTGRFIAPAYGQGRVNPDGEASGAITISDGEQTKIIKLKYAYATAASNLYFTDKPLPEDSWLWSDYVAVMSRDGKLNALSMFSIPVIEKGKRAEQADIHSEVHSAAADCKDHLGRWDNIHGRGQLEMKSINNHLSGTISSEAFQEYCGEGKQITVEFQVTFRAMIAPDRYGEQAAIEDAPGMAYSQFYKAVMAEESLLLVACNIEIGSGRKLSERSSNCF